MKPDNSFRYTAERINYKGNYIQAYTFGSGEKIILSLPSFPHSGLYYLFFTRFYDSSKFKFVTFDLPGWTGWSENIFKDKKFSFDTIIDIAETVIKHYQIKNFSIIGYSFGGALALRLGAKHIDKINNLVLVSAVVNGEITKDYPLIKWLKLMRILRVPWIMKLIITQRVKGFRKVLVKDINTQLLDLYERMLKNADPKVLQDSAIQLFENKPEQDIDIIKTNKRVLVVNSKTEDALFHKQAEYLRRYLSNEHNMYITGHHDDFLLKPRSDYIKHVIDFLLS